MRSRSATAFRLRFSARTHRSGSRDPARWLRRSAFAFRAQGRARKKIISVECRSRSTEAPRVNVRARHVLDKVRFICEFIIWSSDGSAGARRPRLVALVRRRHDSSPCLASRGRVRRYRS
ncbi:MAG: hypothetical protein [Cressdnaviricota sp.]|nr:MAG: hypothetical protein [Cressdnaviricota sp.]